MKDSVLKTYLNLCQKEKVISQKRELLRAQLLDFMSRQNRQLVESKRYVLTLEYQQRKTIDSAKLEKYLGSSLLESFKKPTVASILRVTPKEVPHA